MLKDLLSRCGLTESEVKVFLSLLESGSTIASLVAKRTGLKRPNVYALLDRLVTFGLVKKHRKGSVTYYSGLDAQSIPQLLENQARWKFNEVQQVTKLLGDELEKAHFVSHAGVAGFDISAVESIEAMYIQLQEFVASDSFDGIFNPQTAFARPEMKEMALNLLRETGKKKAHIREIIVPGPMADWYRSHIQNPYHLIKEVDPSRQIISDVIILPDAVMLLQYGQAQEAGIRIGHSEFHTTMKTMFEMLWESI